MTNLPALNKKSCNPDKIKTISEHPKPVQTQILKKESQVGKISLRLFTTSKIFIQISQMTFINNHKIKQQSLDKRFKKNIVGIRK